LNGDAQSVAPLQLCPPHCPYCATVGPEVLVGAVAVDFVVDADVGLLVTVLAGGGAVVPDELEP